MTQREAKTLYGCYLKLVTVYANMKKREAIRAEYFLVLEAIVKIEDAMKEADRWNERREL